MINNINTEKSRGFKMSDYTWLGYTIITLGFLALIATVGGGIAIWAHAHPHHWLSHQFTHLSDSEVAIFCAGPSLGITTWPISYLIIKDHFKKKKDTL